MKKHKFITALTCFILVSVSVIQATAQESKPKSNKGNPGEPRGVSINFEDDAIESMNKNPLDSIEHEATLDKEKQPHLYQKRKNFKPEMQETAKDMRWIP